MVDFVHSTFKQIIYSSDIWISNSINGAYNSVLFSFIFHVYLPCSDAKHECIAENKY